MISLKSVKVRLTLSYALILTVLLSCFAAWMYTEFARVLRRDMDQNLINEVFAMEQTLKPWPERFSRLDQENAGDALAKDPQLIAREMTEKIRQHIQKKRLFLKRIRQTPIMTRLLSLENRVLLSNLKGWQTEIIFPDFERDSVLMEKGESFQTIYFRKKPMRLFYHFVTHKGRRLFVFQMGVPAHEVEGALKRLSFIIWIAIPVAVVAACLAGMLLARRSFRPVDDMIKQARQITAAYLKGRLPRTQAGDELDRLAETLNEMMDRIESSTNAIQGFSSDVSHELKTPLAIIRGEIDLALRKSRSQEELVKTFGVIGEEVDELIRLVDDLMLLVRSDSKQLHLERKEVSMASVLTSVASRFRDRAHSKGIELIEDIGEDATVKGDIVYLKRLFSNLVDNAIKFTPEKGEIKIRLVSDADHVEVEVIDNGVGIDFEMQAKVFSRFYRTDQARSQEGAGLGLNIAKAICDAHQAQIEIHSQPRQGTQARVFFSRPAL